MEKRTLLRLLPPLAFISALLALVFLCSSFGITGLPPTEKRYVTAKARITQLKQDIKKGSQREPWEKLAQEFHSIYEADPHWPNRAAVLYREAESLEELSRRSCLRSDARKAIAAYDKVALKHASSQLADDALYRAALIRASVLKDNKGALSLLQRLKRQYPKGDMYKDACNLEKMLSASSQGKALPKDLVASLSAEKDEMQQKNMSLKKFAGDVPLAYKAALTRMETLRKDSQKSCWRQPWEDLRNEFLRINKSAKKIAADALFQAAVCQQSLAKCSRLASDAEKAISLFTSVINSYPAHNLADDALLNIAILQYGVKKLKNQSIATLNTLLSKYPKGDKAAEAKKFKTIWFAESSPVLADESKNAAKKVSTNEPGELQVLSWTSPARDSVEIVLELSSTPKYEAKMLKAEKNLPNRLIVNLKNTSVIDDIKKGVTVNGSLLQAIKVGQKNNNSSVQFNLKRKSSFQAKVETNPPRLILSVSTEDASRKKAKSPYNVTHVNNLASQLGLTVHRIFIDAGHGGTDPGTSHNNILEKNVTLDIAMTLGKLLRNNGFEVIYSRSKNIAVPLSKRTALANEAGADLFVSIHVNAHDNSAVNGFETYFLNLTNNKRSSEVAMLENAHSDKRLADLQRLLTDLMMNAKINESKRLAEDIQRISLSRLKKNSFAAKNNGVKSAPFHVLLGAQMPAVLVEVGYCTNKEEARNLSSLSYRSAIAAGIAEGIIAYRDRLLKNRTADNRLTDKKPGAM